MDAAEQGVKRKRASPTKGPCEHGVKYRSQCKVCRKCEHGRNALRVQGVYCVTTGSTHRGCLTRCPLSRHGKTRASGYRRRRTERSFGERGTGRSVGGRRRRGCARDHTTGSIRLTGSGAIPRRGFIHRAPKQTRGDCQTDTRAQTEARRRCRPNSPGGRGRGRTGDGR